MKQTALTSSTKRKRTIHDFFSVCSKPKKRQELVKTQNNEKETKHRYQNGTPLTCSSMKLDTPPSPNSLSCFDGEKENNTPPSSFSSIGSSKCKTSNTTHTGSEQKSSFIFTPPSNDHFGKSNPDSKKNKDCMGNKDEFSTASDDVYRIELSVSTTPSHLKQLHAKRRMKTNGKNSDSDQFFLDFGQSDFGSRTICPICNMLYVHGLEEDENNHAKICKDYALGVPFTGWKNERIVDSTNHYKIVQIRPNDPMQHRKKILQVKTIVDQELGFLSSPNGNSMDVRTNSHSPTFSASDEVVMSLQNKTVFLYVVQKRVVGFCSVEVISKAYKLLESCQDNDEAASVDISSAASNKLNLCSAKDPKNEQEHKQQKQFYHSKIPTKAVMGVHQIWCHRSHRKAGIASKLVDVARSKLVFGMNIPFDQVAFSSPTIAGIAFARRYMETNTPLVYTYFNTQVDK